MVFGPLDFCSRGLFWSNAKRLQERTAIPSKRYVLPVLGFSTHLFNKLVFKDDERRKEKLRVQRLKSFIDIQGKVDDELPMPDDDEDDVPVIPPELKRKLNL